MDEAGWLFLNHVIELLYDHMIEQTGTIQNKKQYGRDRRSG